MNARTLCLWRAIMRLEQTAAAEKLGCSRRQYQHYEAGTQPIPRQVALACAALFAGLGEWIPETKKETSKLAPFINQVFLPGHILITDIGEVVDGHHYIIASVEGGYKIVDEAITVLSGDRAEAIRKFRKDLAARIADWRGETKKNQKKGV